MNGSAQEVPMKRIAAALLITITLVPTPTFAHHGGVTLVRGPGSPIETFSPLTMPKGGLVFVGRFEPVGWKPFEFAEPENKTTFSFFNAGAAYGITSYLTGSLFLPAGIKRQETLGTNDGVGDVFALLSLGFNHTPGKGLGLNRLEDTAVVMEESTQTFFSLNGGMSFSTGGHEKVRPGETVPDPGMQIGFGSASYMIGFSSGRRIAGPFSLATDVSGQFFTERDDFKFGTELRANVAGVYALFGRPSRFLAEVDGILEANYLQVARDEEFGAGLPETGGRIVYLTPGVRLSFPTMKNANLGLAVKVPVWKSLNEQSGQQGAEGLESYRAIVVLSLFF